MNRISGNVVLKESNLGIPDLLVVMYDVDPNTKPEESGPFSPGDRLGSVLTDRNGAFSLSYEDEDFRVRNADEKRPDLLLMILPPEESATDGNPRPLFVSSMRQDAGRNEQYLIRLTAQKLQDAGIPPPIDPALHANNPDSVIHTVSQVVAQRVRINEEVGNILMDQVAQVRTQTQQIKTELESRLIEKLTGVPNHLAERMNFVPPGEKVEPVAWRTINKNIDQVINQQPPIAGFIVVPESEIGQFKDANGDFRSDISANEIEPLIFGGSADEERPISLIREDPVSAVCKSLSHTDPLEDITHDGTLPLDGDSSGTDTRSGSSGNGSVGTATADDIPKYLDKVMNGASPDESMVFGGKRATQGDVHEEIQNFSLHAGPADVPALYDFHNLQIAFDYIWQQAIDEGVIETGKELSRQIIEMGGDPLTSLQSGGDPVKVLRSELKNVQIAQSKLNAAGVSFSQPGVIYMKPRGEDESPDPDSNPRPPKPRPPVIRPPFVRPDVADDAQRPRQPHELLDELEDMLAQRYKFEVFAPGSINFGLLVTYRQKWEPITYQVGNLVKTITMAPKEMRKVSAKRTIKKERSIKEMENNLRVRKDEMDETTRDEAEIVQKAQGKTNFTLTAQGAYNIGIAKGDSTTTFGKDAETSSQETKKSFREAILKSSQEYRDERKIEVETKETFDEETTESAEITNPNEELTVTYLFYELQRSYKISERIHRLSPVVLVAMEVPNPNHKAIDQILLAHSWIINRVLLDDRYRAPLQYLCTQIVGDELALREMLQTVSQLRAIVEGLKKELTAIVGKVQQLDDALARALEIRAKAVSGQDTEGMGEKAVEWIFGSDDKESVEAERIREETAREAYEKAVKQKEALLDELRSESAALNAATEAYAKAYAEHSNHLLEIAGLRVHFKENALYYMQAIWSFSFQDQIFFTIHKLKVPALTSTQKTYSVSETTDVPASIVVKPGYTVLEVHANVKLKSDLDPEQDFVTLAEVADLDNPLGFKGNYIIFPLKKSNALTDFMMMPYVDSALGLHDPDELGNWTPEDFVKYVHCLKKHMLAYDFASIEGQLRQQYMRIVSAPRPSEDTIVIPTGSLYIESLPGAHPILEDFKLLHRIMDVKKVRAEVRKVEMENIRYAARILSGEREDPDIEKKILVEGSNGHTIVNPEV